MKRLLIGALLAIAMGSASHSRPPPHGIQFVDLTDDFARIYDRDVALPEKERLARLKAEFATLIPGFYDARRSADGDEVKYDSRIARALARYPKLRAGIAKVSADFAASLAKAQATFERAIGPLPTDQRVFLLNSFGEMDGGNRELPGGYALVFGADVIAQVHANEALTPFFHHELFHAYHRRQVDFDACNQIWCALWGEGLAVYVSQQLNPQATDSEMGLTSPEPLRPVVDAHVADVTCATVARLDSKSDADYGAMFGSARLSPTLPPRFGYYMGYLVARDIGRTRSLKQMAKLQGPPLKALIDRSLARMATCHPESPNTPS